MKNINISLISFAVYIGWWIGVIYSDVGTPVHMTTPTMWYHIITIPFIIAFPFYLGWDAHKYHIQNVDKVVVIKSRDIKINQIEGEKKRG